jgi:hypothetical protein
MKYVSLSETIKQNGERHMANAYRYEAAGLPEYAAGSRRKAERNFARAESLRPEALPPVFEAVCHALVLELEHAILHGHKRSTPQK